jgi:hypothetical protein
MMAEKKVKKYVPELSDTRMFELGDQQMYCHQDIEEGSAAKVWFESQDVKHTSIDLNGLLGAEKYDLSQPIDRPEWVGAFDIVTDFGTSEHVANLYQCFKTCHDVCKLDGLIIHSNPKIGNWPGHGFHYFTEIFYRILCDTGLYQPVDISENYACGNSVDGWQINATLRKIVNEFITEDHFNQIRRETC